MTEADFARRIVITQGYLRPGPNHSE